MTKDFKCSKCQQPLSVDLNKATDDVFIAACPNCAQRYRISKPVRQPVFRPNSSVEPGQKDFSCKHCRADLTVDLNKGPGPLFLVACPKCGQRYRISKKHIPTSHVLPEENLENEHKEFDCLTCRTPLTVNLTSGPSSVFIAACPNCNQRYRIAKPHLSTQRQSSISVSPSGIAGGNSIRFPAPSKPLTPRPAEPLSYPSNQATSEEKKEKKPRQLARVAILSGAALVLLALTAWWFLDLRHRHTLTEDERLRASEWLQPMESGPWVLLDRNDLASTYGTLQAQASRIVADKYGHLKIEVALNHVDANSSTLYNNVFERDHTDLYRPDLIQLFDQEEEIGAGGSLQVRWVAPDSAVVNFLGEEGPGLDLICIPQDRHAQLVERLAADQKTRFKAQVDSLLADGGLLRRGVFRSYGCGDECHATFLEVINGQPMERSYICNNNRFGNIQLSSGDLLGAGDFTNRTLVGTQLLFVTKRALQDDGTLDVITGLTPVSESDITADIQMRLNLTAQFDAVDLANDPTTSEISHPSTSPHGMAKDNKAIIHTIVEEMPSFPGGEAELFKYLSKNVRYPQTAQDAGITGVVYLTFVVGADGRIRDTKVLRGIGGGCDEEALRVARSMPPWNPGRQRGQTVNVQYNLPVRFLLR